MQVSHSHSSNRRAGTWRRFALGLLLATTVPANGTGATPEAAAGRPDVLLVTVDTLRPDALGWVSGRNATPVLDRLAREGFRFPAAISPVPLTLPAHASLMTGLDPRRHGVRDNGQVLSPAPALLAERLREAGYRSAAFVSGAPLGKAFGLARGFDHYDDRVGAGSGAWLERAAASTTAAALAWMAQNASANWFLWVHYYEPHYPYEPPPELRRAGWRGGYDGEVAVVDRALGELLAGLPSRDRPGRDRPGRDRLTVFTADHGESLGEHGEGTHGFFIYDSTTLVPLVLHSPGRVAPGLSDAPARLVDVAPTVLALLGLPPLGDTDGVSLSATLRGGTQELPPAYAETWQPWTSYGWAPLRSVRHEGWKLIAAPRPELYDLRSDPLETTNLVREERARAHRLAALLAEIEARPAAAPSARVTDPETLAALAALGYVDAGPAAGTQPGPGLPDPKDRVALREVLTEADDLLRRGEHAAAAAKFDEVLAVEPGNRFALSRSGEALVRGVDLRRGIARLREAVVLDPERGELRSLLGEALTRTGDYEAAIREWMELVRLVPGEPQGWSNLGATLGKAGRADDAVDAFRRAVELAPGDPDRLTRLAFAEYAAGRRADAADHLLEVERLIGRRFPHSGALGLILLELGRREEARPWLGRSRRAEGEFPAARYALAVLEAEAGHLEAARKALDEALQVRPELARQAAADVRLTPLLK